MSIGSKSACIFMDVGVSILHLDYVSSVIELWSMFSLFYNYTDWSKYCTVIGKILNELKWGEMI